MGALVKLAAEESLSSTEQKIHSIDQSAIEILYKYFFLNLLLQWQGKERVHWSRGLCLVVEHSYLFASQICRIIQVFSLAYVVLCTSMCSFPTTLFPRGLNERGYHEQLQQQHQQKQQALDPRFPVLSWACAAPGVSGVVAICRLRISVLSDPMGCKQQSKGEVRISSLFFPFCLL